MVVTAEGHDHTDAGFDVGSLVPVVTDTLAAEGVVVGHVDLFAVDPDEMAELNQAHMGKSGPTDVLSFPLDDGDGPELDLPGLVPHIGDLVLCPAVAEAQAAAHAGTVEAELHLLVIHGVLHLLGHDHSEAEETEIMRGRERVNLVRYGFGHPEPVPDARP